MDAERKSHKPKRITYTEDRELLVHPKVLKDEQVPPQFRDFCAHLLVPLNRCRYDTYFMPWKCEEERHAYEHCQYLEHLREVNRKYKGEE